MRSLLAASLLACVGPSSVDSADTDADEPAAPLARYVMAFHTCDPSQGCSTFDHQTWVVVSDDFGTWQVAPGYTPYVGSVPDLVRRGDTLYLFTVGEVRRYRYRDAEWEDPVPVTVSPSQGFVDPAPTVDEDGRLVVFFLENFGVGDPSFCEPAEAPCTKRFLSATEVDGSDGTAFELDDGPRLELTLGAGEHGSDPDVFADDDGWVLLVSHGDIEVYRSDTLRGLFDVFPGHDEKLTFNAGSVASGLYVAGDYRIALHTQQAGRSTLRHLFTDSLTDGPYGDGRFAPLLAAEDLGFAPGVALSSPGVALDVP